MRSTNLMIQKVAESLGLVPDTRHQNWPNLVLAKLQTAITFGLASRIGHIVYRFGVENEIYESNDRKSSRVSWFGTGCTTPKPAKYGFAKTSNCHNFWPHSQNWTYCIWFWGRKMRSTNLMIQKVTETLGLVLVPRHEN